MVKEFLIRKRIEGKKMQSDWSEQLQLRIAIDDVFVKVICTSKSPESSDLRRWIRLSLYISSYFRVICFLWAASRWAKMDITACSSVPHPASQNSYQWFLTEIEFCNFWCIDLNMHKIFWTKNFVLILFFFEKMVFCYDIFPLKRNLG
jgi:hypothetical protein